MMDSVKRAFALSAKALKLFYLLAAVNVVTNLISNWVIPASVDPMNMEMSAGRSFGVIGITGIFSLISVFIYSGSIAYVRDLIKTGSGNLAPFADNGKKYFLRLLAVIALIILVYLIIGIILSVILGILPQAIKGLLVAFMVLVFIALSVLFVMPAYALIGSDMRVIESIKRGVQVGRNNFLKILGIMAILALVFIGVVIVASIVTGILSLIFSPLVNVIGSIIMAIVSAIFAILVNITYMDFYLKS